MSFFPSSPSDGDTTLVNGISYQYNSTLSAWKIIPWTGGITSWASATPPGGARVGDEWYSTTEDILYRYINDGTSNNWIDISSATSTTEPGGSSGGSGSSSAATVGYSLVFGG